MAWTPIFPANSTADTVTTTDWYEADYYTTGAQTSTIIIQATEIDGKTWVADDTDSIVGLVIFHNGEIMNTGSTYTLRLYEDNGGGFTQVASQTWDGGSNGEGGEWHNGFQRIDLTTPYAMTSGYSYKWSIQQTAGSTGQMRLWGSSSVFAHITIKDTNPSAIDTTTDLFCISPWESEWTVTLKGTSKTFGTGTRPANIDNSTAWANLIRYAMIIEYPCKVTDDLTADVDITWDGGIKIMNGEWGNTTAIDSAYTVTHTFDNQTSNPGTGIEMQSRGRYYPKGQTKTAIGILTGGDGSTGDPLTFTDRDGNAPTNWAVGDLILVTATEDSTEQEWKYIKTMPTTGSATLADTAGGAESALSNTHSATDGRCIIQNHTRNYKLLADTPATYYSYLVAHNIGIGTNRFFNSGREYLSPSYVEFNGFGYVGQSPAIGWNWLLNELGGTATSCAIRNAREAMQCESSTGAYINDCVVSQISGHTTAIVNIDGGTAVIDGLSLAETLRPGLSLSACSGSSFKDLYLNGCNSNSYSPVGGIVVNAVSNLTFTDGHAVACGGQAIMAQGDFTNSEFKNFNMLGTVPTDYVLRINSGRLCTLLFENTKLELSGSDPFYSGSIDVSAVGTEVKFHKYNATERDHRRFTKNGTKRTTGSGLSDTTVYKAGSWADSIQALSDTNYEYISFFIIATAGEDITFSARARKNSSILNASFEMFLPGSTTPDASYDLTTTDEWEGVSLIANYAGSVSGVAEVRYKVRGNGGTAYVDTLYGGGNPTSALDLYYKAEPSPLIVSQVADAAAIWTYPTTNLTTANTTGKTLVDISGSTAPSVSEIADGVWDEALSGHTTAGTAGKAVKDAADSAELASIK